MTKRDSGGQQLNARQRAFIHEYLKDKNATQAAIRAGYSASTARQIGSRLLTQVDIKRAVLAAEADLIARVQVETHVTLERVIREIARAAFFDPRKFFTAAGELKPITELDDETAAALAGFDVTELFHGGGTARRLAGYVKRVRLADRKGYLDMLMKHLGGYRRDNEQQQPPPFEQALAELLSGLHRSNNRLPIAPE
jgi:phage terminase small subunit